MSIFISIIIFIAILTALIFVHEIGHYITAKRNKVKVEEFGLGLPPRIWGFERHGTLWSINWIPLGGFCKMAGEEDPNITDSLASKSVKARLIVLSAGSIFMLLFPLILLPFSYMLPLSRVSEDAGVKISAVITGSPADLADIKPDDILLSINGQKVNSFTAVISEIQNASDANPSQPITLLVAYENGSIRGNFSAVSITNPRAIPITNPPAGPEALGLISGVLVENITNGSSAYNASLQVGDIIISVDGKVVDNNSDVNDTIKNAVENKPNESVTLLVARNIPGITFTVKCYPIPHIDQPRLGVVLSNYQIIKHIAYVPWQAIPKGLAEYGSVFVGIKDAFGMLFSGQVAAKDALSGPIGIAQLTNEVSAAQGAAGLFSFAALLSIVLGLINLFPFPGLDGGRLVFVIVEGIRRGKRISPKTEGRVHLVGFVLLLLLFVAISYNDILRIVHHQGLLK